MQQILQNIEGLAFQSLDVLSQVSVGAQQSSALSAINPSQIEVEVGECGSVSMVLLHGGDSDASINIRLRRDAKLQLTQLCVGEGKVSLSLEQGEGSESCIVAGSVSNNSVHYNISLCGEGAHSSLSTLQLGGESDRNSLSINMRHLSAGCSSSSLSKCVASGSSALKFDGLVYVAKDAQRTDAQQNCRCIELSDSSHIEAQPQLEIYADDVKCSHGATMGQVDFDAILYMRQRGLSESQARRVQIEGFVTDVVDKCQIEALVEPLERFVSEKLEKM